MAKIKWKSKTDIDYDDAIKENKRIDKEQFKGKSFKKLSSKEKDKLLEMMAKQLGYI